MKKSITSKSTKRTVCLLVVLLLLLSALVGCGNKSKTVELTAENINEYFQFNVTYGDLDAHTSGGIAFAFVDVIVEAYPTVSGKLSNVKIKAEIKCPVLWTVSSSDPAYNEDDTGKMLIDIVMPADGKYTSTHRIGRAMYSAKPEIDCTFNIIEAEGTITID